MKTKILIQILLVIIATLTITSCGKSRAYIKNYHQDSYSEWGYYDNDVFHHVLSAFELEHKDSIDVPNEVSTSITGCAIVIKDNITYIDLSSSYTLNDINNHTINQLIHLREIEHRIFYDITKVEYEIKNRGMLYIENIDLVFVLYFEGSEKLSDTIINSGDDVHYFNTIENFFEYNPPHTSKFYGKKVIDVEIIEFFGDRNLGNITG